MLIPRQRFDCITQTRIASRALMDIFHNNAISEETLKLAQEINISPARLHAMTIFLETKGPPKQFSNND